MRQVVCPMRTKLLLVGLALLAILPSRAGAFARSSSVAASINPADFSSRVDNPWFPLKPGTTYVYRGIKDGQPSRDVLKVTHKTKEIQGAACVVVQDLLYIRGKVHERTTDWYTQDKDGNVWYFGEQTAEFDKQGRVTSTEGTWQAGRNGAIPGIFFPANPKLGRSGRQEFYKGHAEDHFEVVGLNVTVKVPYMSSKRALLTKEWTPLEPGVLDHKFYVRGIGTVLEQTVKGGNERNALVSFQRGG
jgi:hypothetical protein